MSSSEFLKLPSRQFVCWWLVLLSREIQSIKQQRSHHGIETPSLNRCCADTFGTCINAYSSLDVQASGQLLKQRTVADKARDSVRAVVNSSMGHGRRPAEHAVLHNDRGTQAAGRERNPY